MRNLFLRWLIALKLCDIAQLACNQAPSAPTTADKKEYAAPLKITVAGTADNGKAPYKVRIQTPDRKKNERVTIQIRNLLGQIQYMQAEFSLIPSGTSEPCVKLISIDKSELDVKISSTKVQEDPSSMKYKDTKKTCPSVKR